MKKSDKIYIIGWCYDDGIIHGIRRSAHKNWFNAVECANKYQELLNHHPEKNRHVIIVGVRPDYVNNKTQGCILGKVCGHSYDDTEWL